MTTFEELQKSDLNTIIPLMQEFYTLDNYPFDFPAAEQLFHEFIENPVLGKAWLIYEDDEAVGYFILTFVFSFEYQGRIAFLDELFISGKARGKGIGSKTMDFIQGQAAGLSVKLIYLEVEEHNTTAQKLYMSKGFAIHKRKLMKFIPR